MWAKLVEYKCILNHGCDYPIVVVINRLVVGWKKLDLGRIRPISVRYHVCGYECDWIFQVCLFCLFSGYSEICSEEEAKKKIYSVCTTTYTGFGALISEELSYKVKGIEHP